MTVILPAAGALERDGLFFLTWRVAFAYLGALAIGGVHVLDNLRHTKPSAPSLNDPPAIGV